MAQFVEKDDTSLPELSAWRKLNGRRHGVIREVLLETAPVMATTRDTRSRTSQLIGESRQSESEQPAAFPDYEHPTVIEIPRWILKLERQTTESNDLPPESEDASPGESSPGDDEPSDGRLTQGSLF